MDKTIESLKNRIKKESYAQKIGMRLVELKEGYAIIEMETREDMENIFGMTHGGAIFSLIDEAFQLSCNSYGTVALALNVNVTYHRSPDRMSKLRAISEEVHRSGKTATYTIRVTDERENIIASCMALAYRKSEKLPFLD
ncbi:MAG: hotdog fold thioesterase [Deltaproteobacteria bacterium]|nr:hotdog fold thioesterase [Deltaproteobacteria bacterium]